jgi:Holliday junction resolvasome RuvABC endonuclease subunit
MFPAIVGLDLSLTCSGVAVITDGAPTLHRVRSAAVDATIPEVWGRIRSTAARVIRLVPAGALVVVEWSSYASKFGQPDERHAQRWLIAGQLSAGCTVVRASPKARAKYAADDGNADKAAVKQAMRAKYPGLVIPDDNTADALALAAMGARYSGVPIDGPPSPQQSQVMRALRWTIPSPEGVTP